MCRPIDVRLEQQRRAATRHTAAVTIATIVILRMSTPPTSTGRLSSTSDVGRLAERPEPEQRDRLQQERDGERRDEHHRRRLAAQRPEHDALHRERQREHDREAERDPDPTGQSRSDANASANAPAMISWP